MSWKEQLKIYQDREEWDIAIDFIKTVIEGNPDEMHAYVYLLFMLIYRVYYETPLPEQYKIKEYSVLVKKYFKISYPKYSENAEYLYFIAETIFWAEWEFGVEMKDGELMLEKAQKLDPENLVYQDRYYWRLFRELINKDFKDLYLTNKLSHYVNEVLKDESSIKKNLKAHGLMGEFILGMKENWAMKVLSSIRFHSKQLLIVN